MSISCPVRASLLVRLLDVGLLGIGQGSLDRRLVGSVVESEENQARLDRDDEVGPHRRGGLLEVGGNNGEAALEGEAEEVDIRGHVGQGLSLPCLYTSDARQVKRGDAQ